MVIYNNGDTVDRAQAWLLGRGLYATCITVGIRLLVVLVVKTPNAIISVDELTTLCEANSISQERS